MARALIRAAALLLLAGARPGWTACIFDANDEITNPFEAGCGDVMLRYTESDNSGNNIALGYPVPVPVASLTPVDGFRDYASLFARHQSLLTLHDEVTGQVVGQTVGGRDIWAYVLGDPDSTTSEGFAEAAVIVNGGLHAREWQTPEAVTGLFEALVDGRNDGGFGQYLIENLTTVLVPVSNVDGFLQTQLYPDSTTADREQPREGRMRRKNLRNPDTQATIDADIATVGDNFWGVDLNRNSAAGFGQLGRSSASVTSLIYRGAAPGTEPEILALQAAATLGPASRLRFYSDTHSFGQVYFAPTTGQERRDAITSALAARMRAASERGQTYTPDPIGSPGIGSTADYFAFTFQIPAWTMEVEPINGGQDYGGLASHGHSGFILPAREVTRMRADVARQYLLGFYRQGGPPAAIAAQIRDIQSGTVVYDARWQANSTTTRALNVSANSALVPGRDYRLWIAFNKPMRIRDTGGAVVAYRGQSTTAAVGTVTLEIPSLTNQKVPLVASALWLNGPGGAPNGYLRYADDAFAVDFTLPATINVAASTPAVLALTVQDIAQTSLDSNPATAVDWSGGNWVRFEDATGTQGDVGGTDCLFKPFIAMQAGAPVPATTATCSAAAPPPPPPPPPPPRSGGGGDGAGLLSLIVGVLWLGRRRPV